MVKIQTVRPKFIADADDLVVTVASVSGATGAPGADGSDGTDGDNGLSAYQVAVANGYSGTEAQWLESLVLDASEHVSDGSALDIAISDKILNEGADNITDATTMRDAVDLRVISSETKWVDTSLVIHSVAGDYTGRYATAGTGTDDRAAIQAALTAATQKLDSTHYSYLKRRAVTVTLPAGVYLISAPSSGSSIDIPEGVTLDASQAMMFFDYPSSATGNWSAILVRQSASLILPSFMSPSSRNSAPGAPGSSNTAYLYDGVRLLGNDNVTSHIGAHGAVEIKGFSGASIRSIGTWVTRIEGAIKLSSAIGYVASNWPSSNIYGYTHPSDLEGIISGVRLHTDLWLNGPYCNETRQGGILGVVSGSPTTPHALDTTRSGGFQLFMNGVGFEHFANLSFNLTGSVVSLRDCYWEEVGNGTAMGSFDNCSSIIFDNPRFNYTGTSVPAPGGGNSSPFNTNVFSIASVQNVIWRGGYLHNTYNAAMNLFSAAASRWEIYPPRTDSNAIPTTDPMALSGTVSIKGTFNTSLSLRGTRIWADATTGAIRTKAGLPSSDTDGDVLLSARRIGTPFVAGVYYAIPTGPLANTTPGEAAEAAVPFVAGRTCTLTTLAVSVTTAGSTGALLRLGIRANGPNGQPGAVLADGGTVAAETTGVKTVSVSVPIVEGETYWLVSSTQGAATTRPVLQGCSGFHDSRIGNTSAASALASTYGQYSAAAGTTTGALPSSQTWTPASTCVRLAATAVA